jgi:hypothetical protein
MYGKWGQDAAADAGITRILAQATGWRGQGEGGI